MPASGTPASMQHDGAVSPQLSRQFPPQPWGVQHVLVAETHSCEPAHAHCIVSPQLSVLATPHEVPQGLVGVQQTCWAVHTLPEPQDVGHWTESPQLSVAFVLHLLPHAAELLGAQQPPSGRQTSTMGFAHAARPSNPQLSRWPQLFMV